MGAEGLAPGEVVAAEDVEQESDRAVSLTSDGGAAESGFIAPTLQGPWRLRFSLHGWLPNEIPVCVDGGSSSSCKTLGLDFIFGSLGYVIPTDLEVRKGAFGAYWHMLAFRFVGSKNVGPGELEWEDAGYLMDVGLSYELARWRLGPRWRVTVEPFAGARVIDQPVEIDLTRTGRGRLADLGSAVPDIGLRTFWGLGEHWNFRLEGDYGGFGIDDNHQTWQALFLMGYRWPGWGVHWNVQVGYRAMRFFDLRKKKADFLMDGRGTDIVFSIEY